MCHWQAKAERNGKSGNSTWHKQSGLMSAPFLSCTVFLPRSAAQRIFYHITNIHNNENTGQIAHSAYARNATPSAKWQYLLGFGMMLSLVFSRRSSLAAMLDSPLPPVGRAISVCRRKRRGSRCAVGFPIPCGVLLRRVTRTPDPLRALPLS